MKVAIVGTGGFIGRHLSKAFEEADVTVVPISSQNGAGIDPITGLLSDNLRLDGANAVVYLAQSPHIRRTPEMAGHVLRVNVVSAVEVAELALKSGAERFIYASTGSVYRPSFHPLAEGDPEEGQDWYTLSKLQGEHALALFRRYLDVHVLRLFGVYGHGQTGRLIPTLIKAVSAGHPVYIERNPIDPDDISGLRVSLGHVDDVVRAIAQMCMAGGPDLLNVAGSEAISVRSAAEAIGKEMEISPVIDVVDRYRKGDLVADVTRFNEFFATPSTPFDVGLRNTIDDPDTNPSRTRAHGTPVR